MATLTEGGMGVVYLASRRTQSGVDLAVVKRPKAELLRDPQARKRFYHEAMLASAIEHPSIVRTLSSGEDQEGPFIVLEYVHGVTLIELLDRVALRRARLDIDVVLVIAQKGLSVLQCLHDPSMNPAFSSPILHRDVCPSNIMLSSLGRVLLSDFGIAKTNQSDVSTDAKYLLGRLPFLAPEYLTAKHVSPALDIYALGVTLWQALCGGLPVETKDPTTWLKRLLREGIAAPSTLRSDIPAGLNALVQEMCMLDPEKRPHAASCQQMLDTLYLNGDGDEGQQLLIMKTVTKYAGVDMQARRLKVNEMCVQTHGSPLVGVD